jgi:sulfoxide reductase heme-binding subunit YedZ
VERASAERWIVKPAVIAVGLVPLGLLAWGAAAGGLGANPIEAITHETGQWSLRLLLVTLAVTPLRRISGWTLPVRLRRILGLLAFLYVSMHLATYVVLDQCFAWADIGEDLLKRPYITVGFLGFLLLTPLAVTSTNGWVRRLGGRRWKRLHRLAYFAAAAGVLHFLWLVKADLLEPGIYAAVLAALLLARVPLRAVRDRARSAAGGLRRAS